MSSERVPAIDQQIDFTASTTVLAALEDLGRTEDVKFSPDNRRLALAGFGKNKIVVFDVDIDASAAGGPSVSLTDVIEITSSSLHRPHGVFFIDDETLVVANRGQGAPIFAVPSSGTADKKCDLSPLQTIRNDQIHRLKSPGSVTVSQIDQGLYELLICNNYAHHVTRHILEKNEQITLRSHQILLSKGLGVPDGVHVDRDRRWIAISNHNAHSVFLYENTAQLDPHSKPDGILRNLNYPHGVRFTPDNNFVLVADAGAPYVNVYAKGGDSWRGPRYPFAAFRVMAETTYRRGRFHPTEGGPKGIDLDSGMNVLVTTCAEQGLAFFDLPGVLKKREFPMDWLKKSVEWRVQRLRDDLRRRRGWK
jgi:DNA-binding beta-propeller fold protein YncE